MTNLADLQRTSLQDLAAEITHARRQEALGRLALLCYCQVRPWARRAQEDELAARAWMLSTRAAPTSRTAFLRTIDALIAELEGACERAGLRGEALALRQARGA
ncbi:hypothetical protein [Delftia sp. Cs1-4]|uniref:hypothetical protein n=1 Tax=Delftia sp. (strain Cs1-4) TaxID=742013 RepID=UPI0012F4C262|nr:hypothetical protein [Delftia sp. Cs1-4]